MHTHERLTEMKRTELQAAAVATFGKQAAAWTGPATNVELREALATGTPPARLAGSGNGFDLAAAIATAIQPFIESQLNETRVREIAAEVCQREGRIVGYEFKVNGETKQVKGRQHPAFPALVKYVSRKRNVMLIGPAGSGKTYATMQLEQLGHKVHIVPCGKQTQKSDVFGFRIPGTGQYSPSVLYTACTEGGIVVFDEGDRLNPDVSVMLNSLLSNRRATFPNGESVTCTENTIFIFCCNTLNGATREYNSASKQDTSTITRFCKLDWNYDTEWEMATFSIGTQGREWVRYCQDVRRAVATLGIESFKVTPRTMEFGAQDLAAGDSWEEVESAYLFACVPTVDVAKVRQNVQRPAVAA